MRLLLLLISLPAWSQDTVPVFGTTVVIPSGLRGDIYHVSPNIRSLSELAKLKPQGTIYTTALNIPPQDFTLGFPGVTEKFEWFAIDYSGRFWIEKPGIYRFRLLSDDGSMLYIDDQLIADNDGIHSPVVRIASLRLDGGLHRIRVPYFQGPRNTVALMLEIAGPGETPRVFSTDEFKPPVNPEDWRYSPNSTPMPTDPDLDRTQPERIPAPRDLVSPKKKKKR